MWCEYKYGGVSQIPFEPFLQKTQALQQMVISFEITPPAIIIPLVHKYAYDIAATSTWLVPLGCNVLGLVYTLGAIQWKTCPAALLIGGLLKEGWLKRPKHTVYFGYDTPRTVKAIAFSLWGPFIEMDAQPEAIVEPSCIGETNL